MNTELPGGGPTTIPFLLAASLLAVSPAPRLIASDEQASRVERLHRQYDFERFRGIKEAAAAIDFEAIDDALLSAAVFHETNRRRTERGLSPLMYRSELREAARIQAQGMAESGSVSHEHPDKALRTLGDRLERARLRAAFAAENVAMVFGLRYEAGKPVRTRERNGKKVFSYTRGGDPIKPHSYLSFAENLLDQWMSSPGHRENILHKRPQELGTAHVHAVNDIGMDIFYSVQVFFTQPGT